MYFRRYQRNILEIAVSLEKLTTDHFDEIINFCENDIFLVPTENVENLKAFLDFHVLKEEGGKSLLKIVRWNYCKKMCLKFAPKEPERWKYFDESDNELFEYDIRDCTLTFP